MRIGIQQTAMGPMSLTRCFARAKRSGAAGVGLCYRSAEEAESLQAPEHLAKLRELSERFGVAITGLYLKVLCDEPSLIGPNGPLAGVEDLIRSALALSAQVGSPDVIVPFFGRNRIEFPKEFAAAKANMAQLAGLAEEHGVVLAVESSLHLGQLQTLLTECGSDYIKACLDTGDVTACRHDAASMILGLGAGNIAQVHLKDVRLISKQPPDFNVRLGSGDVAFEAVANALKRVGYDGWLILETPSGDGRGAIVALHVEYAAKIFNLRAASADESMTVAEDAAK